MSVLHLYPPPFFPVTWLVVMVFFVTNSLFFTNMVRCYIRTPLKLTFLNSVTFFLPIFLSSFPASGLIIKYFITIFVLHIGHRPYASVSILRRGQPKLICFKKLTSKTKASLLVAWISSDYFESLLLPQLLRGENDSKQSDEFQATLLVYTREHAYVFLVLFSVHKITYM